MFQLRSGCLAIGICALLVSPCLAAEPIGGWRGNGTGLWPDARPPLEWQRIPRGVLNDLRARGDRPAGAEAGDAARVEKGLVRDWLVIGPFPVGDSVKDFDQEPLPGLATVQPVEGDKVGDLAWKPAAVPADDIMVFGQAELPWLDLAPQVGFQRNQLAYAHTNLFSPRGGPARIVVQHGHGLRAWVNGKAVYRSPQRQMVLAYYVAIGRHELNHSTQSAPHFDIELQPGWNRLLLKLSTSNKEDLKDLRCGLRLMEAPSVGYNSKNVRWLAELPNRSTSTPIIVGDRLFVMAEPDELLCLDRDSGRILWSAANNYYEALTTEEKKAQPAFQERIEPLLAELKKEKDFNRRIQLRGQVQKTLLDFDAKRFEIRADGHFEGHFGIVGFTVPTPVSDGRHVYVWCGTGVAACYDLEGKRQWITRVEAGELSYASTPALADGVLAVFLGKLHGLDARTGKLLWRQTRVNKNQAGVLGTRLAGGPVFVTQLGHVVRPADGHILYRPRVETANDTGWSPPTVIGDTMYLPKYGVTHLTVLDFKDAEGDEWTPKTAATIEMFGEVSRKPNGGWIDRWTAGSPLIHDGLAYQIDIYGMFYVIDLSAKKLLYRKELDLHGLTHYNALAVAASPTLIGKHIFVMDNQGTTLVLEPGREFRQVAKNRIATQLERGWPIPGQETLTYAPPVTDGKRLYVRGERYLYCIGTE